MRIAQYMRQEKSIAAADRGGIRERWMWGLRVLNDPEAMSSDKSLRHGVTDQLVKEAAARGYKLSAREIRYRIQCARVYTTEAQIGKALADFDTWWDLIQANFPPYEVPEEEPLADYRTKAERTQDRGRALMELMDQQSALFPLDDFDPRSTTLKELQDYTEEMETLTARFAERDRRRRAYLEQLIEAAGEDLSVTWKEAHDRLDDVGGDDGDPPLDPDDI